MPKKEKRTRTKIAVIGTGGTFAMHGAHDYDWIDYFDSGIIYSLGELLERHPLNLAEFEILTVDYKQLPSTGITPTDWVQLSAFIQELQQRHPDLSGIVLTHDTASLEETAYYLNLTHQGARLIVTGAQRPANTAGSDAITNLRAAIFAAASPTLPESSVNVVFDGFVYSTRDILKTGNHQLNAFEAPEFGPLARIEPDGSVTIRRQETPTPFRLNADQLKTLTSLPRVDIVYSYAGADNTAIKAFCEAGASGLIIAGFPPGRSANGERQALVEAVKKGVVVVQSSRSYRGMVPDQSYNREEGILGGGQLTVQKARVLLMLMLATKTQREDMQKILLEA